MATMYVRVHVRDVHSDLAIGLVRSILHGLATEMAGKEPPEPSCSSRKAKEQPELWDQVCLSWEFSARSHAESITRHALSHPQGVPAEWRTKVGLEVMAEPTAASLNAHQSCSVCLTLTPFLGGLTAVGEDSGVGGAEK